jgi:hypothetical protein
MFANRPAKGIVLAKETARAKKLNTGFKILK